MRELELLEGDDIDLLCGSDTLFHYTTYEVFYAYMLMKSGFRFSNIEETNDPNEYKYFIPAFAPIGSSENGWQSLKIVKEIRQKMCIGCFCQNVKDTSTIDGFGGVSQSCGFSHSRMWSQYGDDHQGVCLAFSKQALSTEIKNICSDKELFFKGAITYSSHNKYDFNSYSELSKMKVKTPEEKAKKYFRKKSRLLLFQKNLDYSQEHEYRFAFYSENTYEFVPLDALRAIIVGDRFGKSTISGQDDVTFAKVSAIGKRLHVPVYRMIYVQMAPYISSLLKTDRNQ